MTTHSYVPPEMNDIVRTLGTHPEAESPPMHVDDIEHVASFAGQYMDATWLTFVTMGAPFCQTSSVYVCW